MGENGYAGDWAALLHDGLQAHLGCGCDQKAEEVPSTEISGSAHLHISGLMSIYTYNRYAYIYMCLYI